MIRSGRSTTSSSDRMASRPSSFSVGGFLGMGTKLIVLPYESLKATENKLILPGATKDALKDLPEFKYATS